MYQMPLVSVLNTGTRGRPYQSDICTVDSNAIRHQAQVRDCLTQYRINRFPFIKHDLPHDLLYTPSKE